MKLIKTFMKYAVGSALTFIVGFLTTVVLTRLFPTEEMGKYSMYITIGTLVASFAYFGLDQSYVRFYYSEKESSRIFLLLKCLVLPLLLVSGVSLVLLTFYAKFSFYLIGEVSFTLVLLFCAYLFGLVLDRFLLLKLRMAQKAALYSLLNILRKLFYLLLAVILYFSACKQNSWALIVSVTVAEFLIILFALWIERKELDCTERELSNSTKQLLKYGFPFVFSTTITVVFHSTDKIMLKGLTDYNQIGLYTGAQNIVNLLSQVQNVFCTFWVPVAFEHYSKNPEDKDFFIRVNKIVSYGMLVIFALVLCLKDVIILFLGPEYRNSSYIFPFLAFMPIMYTVSETTVLGINFEKQTHYHVWISFACAVTNMVGNFFLITRYGVIGAAISTGASYIVFFVLRTVFAQKIYPVQFALKRFGISCALVAILALLASFYPVTRWYVIAVFFMIAVISWLYRDTVKELLILLRRVFKKREA